MVWVYPRIQFLPQLRVVSVNPAAAAWGAKSVVWFWVVWKVKTTETSRTFLGGGNSNILYVHSLPGKLWSNLTCAYFSNGLKPPTSFLCSFFFLRKGIFVGGVTKIFRSKLGQQKLSKIINLLFSRLFSCMLLVFSHVFPRRWIWSPRRWMVCLSLRKGTSKKVTNDLELYLENHLGNGKKKRWGSLGYNKTSWDDPPSTATQDDMKHF